MNHPPPNIAALRWKCRRGMLELDLLLAPFLENEFSSLTESEQQLFIRLLEESDQDLFNWLIQREIPSKPDIAEFINKILNYAKTGARH
jgi:antitoxin CptB